MARVSVKRKWSDGEGLRIKVKVKESFPDAVDEAVTAALRGYYEALGVTMTSFEPESDEDVV